MTTRGQTSKRSLLLGLATDVESEMKRLGLWTTGKPPAATPEKAFGADSLSFEEWLQHIFLPNLRKAALSDTYPSRSSVAVAAARNLDGVEGAEHLIGLLSRVDDAIERA